MNSETWRNEIMRGGSELVLAASEQQTHAERGTRTTGRAIFILNRTGTSRSELERNERQRKATVGNDFYENIRATTQQCDCWEYFAGECHVRLR